MKMVDVQNLFHMMEPRTLKAAYMFYCGLDLVDAHAAEADTLATYEVLKGQLDRYAGDPRIENNVDKLARFSTKQRTVDYAGRLILNDKDEPVISFGKHKGKTAREVYYTEPSYFAWIENGDFTLDTKRQFAKLKAQYDQEKKAAAQNAGSHHNAGGHHNAGPKPSSAPRTKGYTPFEGLGDLFAQQED
jgi:DNA polymerase-3 subunit epsilon